MDFENILYEKRGNVGIITINRPQSLNALNRAVMGELRRLIDETEQDEKIGAVIITGAGEKAFVVGADIEEFLSITSLSDCQRYCNQGKELFDKIETFGKPIIAAVNGLALGGGCELALACTLRVASQSAKFGFPELSSGVIPGWGGTQRLPRLVGQGRALEIMLTGRNIDAQEAYQIGLVNKVVSPEKLLDVSIELAETILKKPPLAVRLAISAVNLGQEASIKIGSSIESSFIGILFGTEDAREGIAAFLEKRPARFKGR